MKKQSAFQSRRRQVGGISSSARANADVMNQVLDRLMSGRDVRLNIDALSSAFGPLPLEDRSSTRAA